MGAGKVVATFNAAAKGNPSTPYYIRFSPFMGFVSLLIGIIRGSVSETLVFTQMLETSSAEISWDL